MAWASIVHGLWLFLPAYVANMSPVLFAKLVPRWDTPIDGGRTDADGNRLLGPGKTWRGLVGGGLAGGLTAVAMAAAAPAWHQDGFFSGWDFGHSGYPGGPIGAGQAACLSQGSCAAIDAVGTPMWAVFLFGFLVGALALVGDAVKSYFKRRTGRPRGAPWVPFDQLDFVVFGVAAMFLGAGLLADGWLLEALLGDWLVLTTLFVLTPLLHFLVNVAGYWLRLKEVPW